MLISTLMKSKGLLKLLFFVFLQFQVNAQDTTLSGTQTFNGANPLPSITANLIIDTNANITVDNIVLAVPFDLVLLPGATLTILGVPLTVTHTLVINSGATLTVPG